MTNLSTALNDPAIKNEATSIIRSLLSEIRLIPEDGELVIEPVGELAGWGTGRSSDAKWF